jgi:hypothetical protein
MSEMITIAPLCDRYVNIDDNSLITRVPAFVGSRLVQAERNRLAGLDIESCPSLRFAAGTLDTTFKTLAERGIIVQPAVNEQLTANVIGGEACSDGLKAAQDGERIMSRQSQPFTQGVQS